MFLSSKSVDAWVPDVTVLHFAKFSSESRRRAGSKRYVRAVLNSKACAKQSLLLLIHSRNWSVAKLTCFLQKTPKENDLPLKPKISRPRAFHNLLEIIQKVAQNFWKRCSKVAPKIQKSCFWLKRLHESCPKKPKPLLFYQENFSKYKLISLWR